MVNHIVESFV